MRKAAYIAFWIGKQLILFVGLCIVFMSRFTLLGLGSRPLVELSQHVVFWFAVVAAAITTIGFIIWANLPQKPPKPIAMKWK